MDFVKPTTLPFRPKPEGSSQISFIFSSQDACNRDTSAGEIQAPEPQSHQEISDTIDTEQSSADHRTMMENSREEPDKTGIVHAGSLPDLVDENGNVVLDDVAQIHAVKRASESVLGNSLAQPIQDNKPDSRSGTEELETHQTTEVTDEISDIESLPYGVKPNPDEERALAHMELDIDVTKTKKKKRRPKTKRGLGAPTGFEPFFADAPLTPDESQEIKKIYDPDLPFHMRYDEAIKRFLFKRRLEPRRRHLFLKYLQYGGVNINQKYGQGVSPQELKEMTKEEGMEARNYTVVSPEWATEGNIAFDTVLKGYLGGYYLDYFSPDDEGEIMVVTGTIKNFLTFLLYHDVCPEYRDDIEKARNTCDLAAKELWKARQVVQNGPGDFNKACSMLFGGNYFDDIDDPEIWETFAEQNRMTQESARWVLKYAIAAVGPDARAIRFKELAETEQFKVKQVEDIDGFEIISIEQPNPLTVAFYKDMAPNLTPVGVVRAKEFRDPAKGEFNLSKLEEEKWKRGEAPSYEFDFLVEGDLLAHCFLGMKALTKVFELNCGIHFFDEIMVCLPSFYVFLANDLMIDYKGPKTKEPTDKWIIMRAEHRKAMEQLAGPKLSDREQARALLKDVTPGADYDAAFGKWKPIPADTKLGFEYDVVPQPGVRAEDEMGIIFPQYDGQKKNEDEIIVKNISEKGGITQGDDTGQIKPKEWWTPEQWWGGEEWYGLMKEWKPTRTPSEHCPEKKTIVKECFSSSKKEENFDQVNANLCSLEQFIKRMDAEMKEEAESLTGKEMGSFSRWLSFAKSHLKNEKFQMMKSQGSVQTEPPNEKTSKNDLERSMQVDGANNIE